MNHRPTEVIERKRGAIEVICGSMFSGKTEELIRRLKRARIAKLKVEIFKPSVDQRYHEINVVSHDSNYIPSSPVQSSSQILLLTNDVDVVGIDEAQFFDNELPNVCLNLANQGMRVIIAGLDMDFKGVPFTHTSFNGNCRFCDQGTCHLHGLWRSGFVFIPYYF